MSDASLNSDSPERSLHAGLTLLYLLFIVYGSLIPFDFRPLPLAEAWDRLLHISYLDLGPESRADWIANIVLYLPFGFLLASLMLRTKGVRWLLGAMAVWLACVSVAAIIEIAQIYFAPRTISLNDLTAEALGSAIGIALSSSIGPRLKARWVKASTGGHALIVGLELYALSYVLASLFPFDFIASLAELHAKLAGGTVSLTVAPAACTDSLRCAVSLGGEILAALPFGLLLALKRPRSAGIGAGALVGALLGLAIESVQLLILSGVGQGLSVLTRSGGAALGVLLLPALRRVAEQGIGRAERWLMAFLVIPYTFLLAALNGWFSGRWHSLAEVMPSIHSRMFLPFYFHYFTTEADALHSLLANLAAYGVLGLAYRLWSQGRENTTALRPALLAAGLALLMEAGKLFVPGKHPDPSNVLLAALGAAAAFGLTAWVLRNVSGEIDAVGSDAGPRTKAVRIWSAGSRRSVLAAAMLAAAAIFLAYFPVASGWLAAGLAVYASLLWRNPLLWLFAVPALLPVLDLAGWSGWFFFDEFDLLLLVTLAVLLVRADRRPALPPLSRSAKWLIGLFTLSYAISAMRGLLPLAPVDANAFASYYSPYNALRLAKSWLWVLAFLPFLRRALNTEGNLKNYLLPGLLVGLAGTIALGLWERWLFPGIGDVASAYRVTAFFSSMHVGGCSIDIYLALAVPVVAACFLIWKGRAVHTVGLLLFTGSIYLVLVTFSRGTYLAVPVSSLVLLAGVVSERSWRVSTGKVLLPLLLSAIVLSLPILLGPYAQERFSTLSRDIHTRIALWREALEFRDDTLMTSLFGMGIGSFPQAYLWADPGTSRPATFRYVSEGSTFLRLGSGTPLYILQRIRLSEKGRYRISARLRSDSPDARLQVLVCEQSLLYSYACKRHDWTVAQTWKDYATGLDLSQFAGDLRPVWLSLSNISHRAIVDVDDLRLADPHGRQLLSNGDFERGHDRWFFTSDDHIAWHTKNLWVHILFEQGWIGMILFAALTAYALVHLTRHARARDPVALILLAPLVGTLSISAVYTTLDTPRIAFLWYWLLVIAAIYSIPLAHGRAQSPRAHAEPVLPDTPTVGQRLTGCDSRTYAVPCMNERTGRRARSRIVKSVNE